MQKHTARPWQLIGILLLAAGLRLVIVTEAPSAPDEDAYLIAARHFYTAEALSTWQNIQVNAEHPPLVKILYSLTLDPDEIDAIPPAITPGQTTPLPENSQRAARLQALAFGLGAVAIAALVHPLAGLLLALDPIHFQHSSLAYLEALPTFFAALAVFAYTRSAGSRRWLWLSGLCLGVAAAGKYPYGLVGLVILAHALARRRSRLPTLILWGRWGMLALATFFVLNPYLWPDPPGRLHAQLTYFDAYAEEVAETHSLTRRLDQITDPNFYLPTLVEHPAWRGLAVRTLMAALLGTMRALRTGDVWGWWLVAGFVFLSVWPTQWIQHNMLISVPYSICAAHGLAWAWQHISRQGHRLRNAQDAV